MKIERKYVHRWQSLMLSCAALLPIHLENATAQPTEKSDNAPMEKVVLFEFQKSEMAWPNVDDVVMGGVSSSQMRIEEPIAIFEGKLSLDNNGGFASVRSNSVVQDLRGFNAVRLRVCGDGKRYQFRIRTEGGFNGASYQVSFETKKDTWLEVDLAFSEFIAAYRGRVLPDEPPIEAEKIDSFGLLIADKQEGPFRLEIDWIQALKK